MADADRSGTSPGVALVDLLRRHAPCLVLIDEWVAYARQFSGVDGLPAGSFDAQFTFAQALAEATRAVDGALMVVSIPASDIEVGGEGSRAALERLKNVIGGPQTRRRHPRPGRARCGGSGHGRRGRWWEATDETSTPPEHRLPVWFYGCIALEPVRMLRDVNDIVDAIVRQLDQAPDAHVSVTVEIERRRSTASTTTSAAR